jgi:hypothetical protein
MRIATIATIGILGVGVALPAAAQRAYNAPAYDLCHRMAIENSLSPGQHGWTEFMRECTSGRVGTYQSPR